jgi:hypothetical protein
MRTGLTRYEKSELIPDVFGMVGHVADLVEHLGPHE